MPRALPTQRPTVVASCCIRLGPSTTSATIKMTISSWKPKSNIAAVLARGLAGSAGRQAERSEDDVLVVLVSGNSASVPDFSCLATSWPSVSPSFMAFLKPLTAPPRSEPMERSFFVPKMTSTTSRMMISSRMPKLPMSLLRNAFQESPTS
jgi:hypothetical protein